MLTFRSQSDQRQTDKNRQQTSSNNNDKRNGPSFSKKNMFQNPSSRNFSKSDAPASYTMNSVKDSEAFLSQEELRMDEVIGKFNFYEAGFQRRKHIIRELPKFLIYQTPPLVAGPIVQDAWDKQNQAKMDQLESKSSDPSSLFEEFQRMREVERQNMEQKGLVDKEGTRKMLDDAISFKGSCIDMCPVYERIRRSVENDIRKYEKDASGKVSKDRAIKAFSRPAAGQPPPLPSDVRPPQILISTLRYLIDNVLQELPEAQSFIWDRTRSIRQDFTYQNFSGPEAIECHEKIVRIHLLTLHVMAKTAYEFSRQQELEQMNKALKTLSEMYTEHRSRGLKPPNEAEFRAYYLLSQHRDPELDREIQDLPIEILQDARVQMALNLRNMIQTNIVERGFQFTENVLNSFKNFFHNFKIGSIPLLMSYIMEVHLNEIRFYAFKSIKRSLHTRGKPYPVQFFVDLLAFNDDTDLEEFCSYYGVQVAVIDGMKHVDIMSLSHNSHLIPDQRPFRQSFSTKHDESVRSYQQLINGGLPNLSGSDALDDHITPGSVQPQSHQPGLEIPPQGSTVSVFPSFSGPSGTDSVGSMVNNNRPSTSGQFPAENQDQFTFAIGNSSSSVPNVPKLQEISDREELKKQNEQRELEQKRKREEEEAVAASAVREAELRATELKRLEDMNRKLVLKKQQKEQKRLLFVDKISSSITSNLIGSVVRDLIQDTVIPLVNLRVMENEKKSKILKSYSESLYEAFISELLYFEILEIVADDFKDRKLKGLFLNNLTKLCKESKRKIDMKKRMREELMDASRNFGIPNIPKRKKIKQNVSEKPVQEVKPVDLTPMRFDQFLINLSRHPFDRYEMLIFSEELESTTSKFLRRKFCINNDLTRTFKKDQVELEVIGTSHINPKQFENVNLLVFNCDGVERIREQKLMLRELVQGICLNTTFKFQILVIYWEFERIINFSPQDILQDMGIPRSDCIESVDLVKLDPGLNCDGIQSALDGMGTRVELTAKGEYNLKYLRPMRPVSVTADAKKPQSPKKTTAMVFRDESSEKKIPRHLTRHIEASPRVKPIPKLLSDCVPFAKVAPLKSKQPTAAFPTSSNIDALFNPTKKHKLKIDVYSTPRPKSSELLQTPSFYGNSSTISNLSNITFASHSSSTPLIIKPTYADIAKRSIPKDNKVREKKVDINIEEEEEGIPRSILELRMLAASVKEKHGHK